MGRKILIFLTNFLEVQLFITLFSLPILLYWGLPISIASPLGNLIFLPFITVFLALSTLIFFTELIFIPNNFLIKLLELVTSIWNWIINFSYKSWLIYLPKPNLLILILLPVLACLIIFYKDINTTKKRILSLSFVLFLTLSYLKFIQSYNLNLELFNSIKIIKSNNKTQLIDNSEFSKRSATQSWIQYTLIPELTKLGVNNIDDLIVLKPSNTSFKAVTQLCTNFNVKIIYLPHLKVKLTGSGWQAWEKLLVKVKENNIKLIFVNKPQ